MIALSTATKRAVIAFDIDGKSDFAMLDSSCKHSENMLKALDEILDKNCLSIKDNDRFAVVIGPGSFTGLRIAIACVKGLCAGLNIEQIIPISTLELIAYSYSKSKPNHDYYTILNGLSGYYFIAKFDKNGNRLEDDRIIVKNNLPSCSLVGLEEENLEFCTYKIEINAHHLLEFAQKKQESVQINSLAPVYLRKSQAEDNLEQKNKKNI